MTILPPTSRKALPPLRGLCSVATTESHPAAGEWERRVSPASRNVCGGFWQFAQFTSDLRFSQPVNFVGELRIPVAGEFSCLPGYGVLYRLRRRLRRGRNLECNWGHFDDFPG
jgi:hypothetical protein